MGEEDDIDNVMVGSPERRALERPYFASSPVYKPATDDAATDDAAPDYAATYSAPDYSAADYAATDYSTAEYAKPPRKDTPAKPRPGKNGSRLSISKQRQNKLIARGGVPTECFLWVSLGVDSEAAEGRVGFGSTASRRIQQ